MMVLYEEWDIAFEMTVDILQKVYDIIDGKEAAQEGTDAPVLPPEQPHSWVSIMEMEIPEAFANQVKKQDKRQKEKIENQNV